MSESNIASEEIPVESTSIDATEVNAQADDNTQDVSLPDDLTKQLSISSDIKNEVEDPQTEDIIPNELESSSNAFASDPASTDMPADDNILNSEDDKLNTSNHQSSSEEYSIPKIEIPNGDVLDAHIESMNAVHFEHAMMHDDVIITGNETYGVDDQHTYTSDLHNLLIEQPEFHEIKNLPFSFVDIDRIEAESGEWDALVTRMSKSGSLESIAENNLIIELRPGTPTKSPENTNTNIVSEIEKNIAKSIDSLAQDEVDSLQLHEANDVIEPEKPLIDRESIIQQIKQDFELKDRYKSKNNILQAKLSEYFKKKRTEETRDSDKSVADQETRYSLCMNQINDLRNEKDHLHENNEKIITEFKVKLEEKAAEISRKQTEFVNHRKKIASESENSKTGKSLSQKNIEQLEALEEKKENEVIAVRLENIKLRNKLRRHEQTLRQKEELADGLHLIDFEQLKIENQTFNEKIEERNEELLKLRKKITNVVQVLTHVKEKLQFVQEENEELKDDLQELDEKVSNHRDKLPGLKQTRDMMRLKNQNLKDRNGLLGNVPLLRDFEEKMSTTKVLKSGIDDLKSNYLYLSKETALLKKKMTKVEYSLNNTKHI